jgi:hypothetical protein
LPCGGTAIPFTSVKLVWLKLKMNTCTQEKNSLNRNCAQQCWNVSTRILWSNNKQTNKPCQVWWQQLCNVHERQLVNEYEHHISKCYRHRNIFSIIYDFLTVFFFNELQTYRPKTHCIALGNGILFTSWLSQINLKCIFSFLLKKTNADPTPKAVVIKTSLQVLHFL